MTTLNASDFTSRGDLENEVRNLLGLTPEPKQKYEIKGTREELLNLSLSSRRTFWGIRCVATDKEPNPPPLEEPIVRGDLKDFGLNGQLKKPKTK